MPCSSGKVDWLNIVTEKFKIGTRMFYVIPAKVQQQSGLFSEPEPGPVKSVPAE